MSGGFMAHTIFGTISDKFGRKFAIILASSIALLACLIFIFINPGIALQYLIVFFLGFGIFVLYALALARANDVVTDKTTYVEVVRALLFSYLIGSFLSTIVIGFLINQFGATAFIYYYITLLAFLIIFATFQKNVPKDQEVAFARHGGHSVIFDELNDDNSK
jgi:MFS family permease